MTDDELINAAITACKTRLRNPGLPLLDFELVKKLCILRFHNKENECFSIMLMDKQMRLIDTYEVTQGSIAHCSVYPRELIKIALHYNAAAAILIHNHPSGFASPSEEDIITTRKLAKTFKSVDIEIVDHIIVAGSDAFSFIENNIPLKDEQ